jgi:hypothetical protein
MEYFSRSCGSSARVVLVLHNPGYEVSASSVESSSFQPILAESSNRSYVNQVNLEIEREDKKPTGEEGPRKVRGGEEGNLGIPKGDFLD